MSQKLSPEYWKNKNSDPEFKSSLEQWKQESTLEHTAEQELNKIKTRTEKQKDITKLATHDDLSELQVLAEWAKTQEQLQQIKDQIEQPQSNKNSKKNTRKSPETLMQSIASVAEPENPYNKEASQWRQDSYNKVKQLTSNTDGFLGRRIKKLSS